MKPTPILVTNKIKCEVCGADSYSLLAIRTEQDGSERGVQKCLGGVGKESIERGRLMSALRESTVLGDRQMSLVTFPANPPGELGERKEILRASLTAENLANVLKIDFFIAFIFVASEVRALL